MLHSWFAAVGAILDSPDPVQAYFSLNNQSRAWTLDCVPNYDSSNICAYDCANISAITNSVEAVGTLWQCAFYPNVTNAFRLGDLSEAEESVLITDHVDTSLAKAAAITSTISSCLSAYCESLEGCKQLSNNVCSTTSLSINGTLLNANTTDDCINTICANHPEPLTDADIAGIGVISSYIIQVSITLLSALALVVLRLLRKAHSRKTITSSGKQIRGAAGSQTSMRRQDHEVANNDQMGKETDIQEGFLAQNSAGPQRESASREEMPTALKVHNALIAALIEFLKAQCFVALAVSIAGLIVLNAQTQTSSLDATALGAASGVSIVPIAFNYYVLATFNTDRNDPKRKSWYLYGLSLCSWVLGLYVVFSPQMLKANRQNKSSVINTAEFNSQFSNACGNASPLNICPRTPTDVHPEFAFYYALCLPVMIGLTIWQLSTVPFVSGVLSAFFYKDSQPRSALFTLMHLAALGFFIAPFSFFFETLSNLFGDGAVSFDWSFGQVIAITLWIPSVTGFFNNLWDGVGPAQTKQMPIGYVANRA